MTRKESGLDKEVVTLFAVIGRRQMGELVRSAEARRISLSYLVRNALQIGLLSHENYRALNKYATKESREVSDLVNEAVRQYILSRDS